MKALTIDATDRTPFVNFDPDNNRFEISGKSIPKDAESFYEPVLEWLDEYTNHPNTNTEFVFNLEFFNIASSKRILFILYKLNEMVESQYTVNVKWCFSANDDDMYEVGQDYAFMVKVPFEFVKCAEEPMLSYA